MHGMGPTALYAGCYGAVPTQAPRRDPKTPQPFSISSSQLEQLSNSSFMEQLSSASIADFLGPAVDSPPSPEKLRQLNEQMKRESDLHRQNGHKAAFSESSIYSITTSDRMPWEVALENLSLVRRSSVRSNDSDIPPRDRPETTHNFGKSLFHRQSRSKRASSVHSSSGSSMYSGDISAEISTIGTREGIIPSLFFKGKSYRGEGPQGRPHISVPFNFQHIYHTQREDLTEVPINDFESSPYCESENLTRDPKRGANQQQLSSPKSFPHLTSSQTAPASGPRRLLEHIRSQSQSRKTLSQAPPRPPRPPFLATGRTSFVPLPPPRISSRQSSRHQDLPDAIGSVGASRPQLNTELQMPIRPTQTEPPNIDGFQAFHTEVVPLEQGEESPGQKRYSCVIAGSRDSVWPLASPSQPSYEVALADVPEEDEQHGPSRQSGPGPASYSSSLKGSQSVPTMRTLAEPRTLASGIRETFGDTDNVEVTIATVAPENVESPTGVTPRETWEDVIDYCYEHEAEADCDYQWDRPSLEIAREDNNSTGNVPAVHVVQTTGCDDTVSQLGIGAPSLSPASYCSTSAAQEPVTPNSTLLHNFSLPRTDKKNVQSPSPTGNHRASSSISELSTFRESQAFTLSPSLLIPGDFQQQILLHDTEKLPSSDHGFIGGDGQRPTFHNDMSQSTAAYKTAVLTGNRLSTSTTATTSTSRSNSTGRQHRSTASSWTALTQRTASSTSLHKINSTLMNEFGPLPADPITDMNLDSSEWARTTRPGRHYLSDVKLFPPPAALKKYSHKSHASDSVIRDEPSQLSSPDRARPRRRRARTSVGAQCPPPVGQYALLPRTQFKSTGDHI